MTRPDPYDGFHSDLATGEGMREPPHPPLPAGAPPPAEEEES